MIQTIEGVFRNGKVELFQAPENISEARVIVTFLPASMGSEAVPSFTPDELAELRNKLSAWEEDWNAPGMKEYDHYEERRDASVFIEFLTESDRIRGFYELVRRSRVQSVSGQIYHLPREALQILDDLHIGYRFVECVGPERGS